MTKDELYSELVSMTPIKPYDEDFRLHLNKTLKIYQEKISKLDLNDRPSGWVGICRRIKQLCDSISRAIESEYRGKRHSAYTSIKNQLEGYKTEKTTIEGLAYSNYILNIDSHTIFYRMREVKISERRKMKNKDIFHIPLNKRGIVATQRYSVPGYPCLYLSHRVYGCWEEMGRPDFGTIMVSRFKNTKPFSLLDLRIPSLEKWNNDFINCLKFFPLVISTMFQVKNSDDNYKPEYVIPQLLTEWIISHNDKDKNSNKRIIGIAYTSAQKNDDFNFPDNSYDNYAIPAVYPFTTKKSNYCKVLKDIFLVSKPTYYDFEILIHGSLLDYGCMGFSKEDDINNSKFGTMESYLNRFPCTAIEE